MKCSINKKEKSIIEVLMKEHVESGGRYEIIKTFTNKNFWRVDIAMFNKDGTMINKIPIKYKYDYKSFDFFDKKTREDLVAVATKQSKI